MWGIFSTMDSNMANNFISHSLKINLKNCEGKRTVEISEEDLNQLY